MKKLITMFLTLALGLGVCVGCADTDPEKEDLKGVTETEIWVGNTAGTTGALATIGVPFNYGIEAAFAAYNAKGGFEGKNVKLKHYDDAGVATNSTTLMDKLIHEDEVFAIVGNYGGYAVNVNLDTIKEAKVPMVYAAAGNDSLYNAKAESEEDKVIFPVQPLYITEGSMLLARAFAAAAVPDANEATGFALTGGMGATKVGVIANQDEASVGITKGIEAEMAKLSEEKKANVVIQKTTGSDFSAQANALVAAGVDTIIVTTTGTNWMAALTALANANYKGKILTSYNNSSATVFNDATTNLISATGADILGKMQVYAQGWLDISGTYVYNKEDSALVAAYKALGASLGSDMYANGVPGFNEEYWGVAEDIFAYVATVSANDAFAMSYNSFALAGYIAGDLFCQGLEALKDSGKELTRANYVEAMESKTFKIAMGGNISYANGARTGVEEFSSSIIMNLNGVGYTAAVSGLKSTDYFRGLIG